MDLTAASDDLLSKIKSSLRIDITDDDELLKSFIIAAQQDISGSVGEDISAFYDDNERFNVAVILLVSHWYQHREAVSDSTKSEVPLGLHYLISSLKDEYREQLNTTTTTTTTT